MEEKKNNGNFIIVIEQKSKLLSLVAWEEKETKTELQRLCKIFLSTMRSGKNSTADIVTWRATLHEGSTLFEEETRAKHEVKKMQA